MNLIYVILLLVGVRLASVFLVQTFYVPDEYWQSLEVAHKLTFGYGYLTWEWVQGIRSYIYPVVIAGIYKVLALLNLDNVQLLIILPRVLQALLSAYSDYRFFVWMGKRKWALFLIVVQWFWFYTCSRTLANTLEASLTTIALSYFPWQGEGGTAYVWLAAFCCFMRPTAVIIWIPLAIFHLHNTKLPLIQLVLKRYLPIGLLVAITCIGVDTFWYGQIIVTPFEFIRYNIFQNIGSFYGSHPWYWYFTVGLPTVLGINFIPFIFGTIETIRHHEVYPVRKQLLITIVLSLLVLSAVEHKEFRFVSSLLPLCLYITADTLTRWSYKASRILIWLIAGAIVFGNVLPAWYLSTVHQRGPISVISPLQQIARNYHDENNKTASIFFLMPCHSTPYYSHIHQNITMRFLTCEPNLLKKPNYKDEADQFYDSPVHWLRSHLPSYPRTALPTHVVLFEPLAAKINDFLLNYKLLDRIENAEHVQSRTGKNILIYQRLLAGEENAFNREETTSHVKAKKSTQSEYVADDIVDDDNENTADYGNKQNLFN